MVEGHNHLVYELRLTNFSASPIELLALEVFGGTGAAPLASYHAQELEKLLVAVGPNDTPDQVRAISGGRSVVVFLDVTLPVDAHPPADLRHRLSFSIPRKKDGSGGAIEDTMNGPVVAVIQEPAPVLRAPLGGSAWIAFNAFFTTTHRRALVPVDGKERIAQRFAIDWMRLGPDGRLFHGDPKSNANFYGYGAEVLAVADGRVSDLKDGLPENAGSNEASSRNITLDNVTGNYVIVDLGHGRFAVYAHLQPGGLKVKLGEKVKAGQALALLGNSGNSDAPHLHFHLVDANSPLVAEGIAYEFDTFTQLGVVDNQEDVLDAGHAWQPKTKAAPVVHRREFPVDNAVVTFP
jgi:murein DD-endopeptidase